MSSVYVFDFEDRIKVGYTTALKTRLIQIQCKLKKKAVRTFSVAAPVEVEALVHKALQPYRLRGEYYTCSFDIACAAVNAAKEAVPKPPEQDRPATVKFTKVMKKKLALQLDYIGKNQGRSRIKEIEQACREHVKRFERNMEEIEGT